MNCPRCLRNETQLSALANLNDTLNKTVSQLREHIRTVLDERDQALADIEHLRNGRDN